MTEELIKVIDADKTYNGRCKWFDIEKGFGFISVISPEIKEFDICVHISNINSSNIEKDEDIELFPDQECTFQIQVKKSEKDPKKYKLSALNVIPGNKPNIKKSEEIVNEFDKVF